MFGQHGTLYPHPYGYGGRHHVWLRSWHPNEDRPTSPMVPFKPIPGDEPTLAHAPFLKVALLTFGYIDEHGPIGLTPTKALKRYFVQLAAEVFAWPHYAATVLAWRDDYPIQCHNCHSWAFKRN